MHLCSIIPSNRNINKTVRIEWETCDLFIPYEPHPEICLCHTENAQVSSKLYSMHAELWSVFACVERDAVTGQGQRDLGPPVHLPEVVPFP